MASPASWLRSLFARETKPEKTPGGHQSIWLPAKRGGVVITQDNALELSACFACIRVISADIAKLPWHVFSVSGGKRTKLDRSQIAYLLNTRPNPETGAFAFREMLVAHALGAGNGYAEIARDQANRPAALWQLTPDRVQLKRRDNGNLVYQISNGAGDPSFIEPENMFHLHGMGFDGLTGYSTIAYAAQSIGFGKAAEQHGSAFYGNNAVMGMVLEHPQTLSEEAHKRLKESLAERTGSGAFRPFIAEEGMKINVPATKQVDAQYIETRQQIVEEICRWFRVPPQKVMNLKDAHYNNVENMNIAYATDTLGEWCKRLEEEADYKLIGSRSMASYTKLNLKALMRGDHQAQSTFYKEMLLQGVYSINEVRDLEDMDPIPEGDSHLVQMQMVPIEKLPELVDAQLKAKTAPPEPNTPTPKEAADNAVQNLVQKFLVKDMQAVSKANARGFASPEAFAEWFADRRVSDRARLLTELNNIRLSLMAGYRNDPDLNDLADRYDALALVSGQKWIAGQLEDMSAEITDALRAAL